jgi:hypothetical protein
MLPDKAIKEFKEIYHNVFHEELSDNEASQKANYIFEFYKAVYLPVESENLMIKQDNERRNKN